MKWTLFILYTISQTGPNFILIIRDGHEVSTFSRCVLGYSFACNFYWSPKISEHATLFRFRTRSLFVNSPLTDFISKREWPVFHIPTQSFSLQNDRGSAILSWNVERSSTSVSKSLWLFFMPLAWFNVQMNWHPFILAINLSIHLSILNIFFLNWVERGINYQCIPKG